jgi:hypothetical protein
MDLGYHSSKASGTGSWLNRGSAQGSFWRAVFAADDVRALRGCGGFVKRNQAISALSTEPAIGGHNEVFKIDVLQLGIVAAYEVNCRFLDLDYGAARGNQFS